MDDTPLLRELAAHILSRVGRVHTVASAAEAMTLARVIGPDLVVADLAMPEVDGAELCRRLKRSALHRDVPVVLLTGSEHAEEHARAVRAGADDVLPRPLERHTLLEAARRLLDENERRGRPRIAIAAPVCLRSPRRAWCGTARNLSRGGVFVESSELLHAHAELELALELPESGGSLASTAQVIWTRPRNATQAAGMGLRFLALDRASARRLSEYVGERLPAPLVRAGGTR